jgi:hypothetical protein
VAVRALRLEGLLAAPASDDLGGFALDGCFFFIPVLAMAGN